MPLPPGTAAIASLLLTALALVLFTRKRIPLEASSLFIICLLAVGTQLHTLERDGERLTLDTIFGGLGNQALIAIAALMICAKGLEQTGALRTLSNLLARAWTRLPQLAFLLTLLVAAALSMVMNNTPIVAMVLPLLVSVSLRTGADASRILMPMGYATIVGGMMTTIGTSTNLLVVGIAADLGLPPFQMFDFALPAALGAAVAIPFLWLVAPHLTPSRTPPMADISPRIFDAILHIGEESRVADKTLAELRERTGGRMKITRIERAPGLYVTRLPTLIMKEGDRLHVRDTRERLKEFEQELGATLFASAEAEQPVEDSAALEAADQQLAEVVVTEGSPLIGWRATDVELLSRHHLTPVALHRPSRGTAASSIEKSRLRPADILLIQGPREEIEALRDSGAILVLDGSLELPRTRHARRTALIMLGVVVSAAFGWLPIALSALLGVGAMLLTGCLRWREAGMALDIRIILLIVAALGLGKALALSGAAAYLAELFVYSSGGLSVALQVSLLMLAMALLTEVVTNNAAVAIGTPIAVSIAASLGADPVPFVLAVLFGGNMSFMTPTGYQTNLLVMSAGGYRFNDFIRVGLPLQILIWLALSFSLAHFYDL